MAEKQQNVFIQIGSEYYSFTVSEKKLADYILSAQNRVSRMSISELSQACGVADATVSRFCRHLGFQRFPDFKLAVANASSHQLKDNPLSGEITREDTLEEISQKLLAANSLAMTQTLEVLDLERVSAAAVILRQSRTVLCMGQGGSMLIAEEAAHLFSTVANAFRSVNDSHMQAMAAAVMEPSDTILFFSYSGSTLAMLHTLKVAKERGGKIVLVTRFPNSPGAQLADVVLQCGANENPLQSGSIPARIAQMYLLDILFTEYTRWDLDRARENRGRIAQALAPKHL